LILVAVDPRHDHPPKEEPPMPDISEGLTYDGEPAPSHDLTDAGFAASLASKVGRSSGAPDAPAEETAPFDPSKESAESIKAGLRDPDVALDVASAVTTGNEPRSKSVEEMKAESRAAVEPEFRSRLEAEAAQRQLDRDDAATLRFERRVAEEGATPEALAELRRSASEDRWDFEISRLASSVTGVDFENLADEDGELLYLNEELDEFDATT